MRYIGVSIIFLTLTLSSFGQNNLDHGGGDMNISQPSACYGMQDEALINAVHQSNIDSLFQAGILQAPIESSVSLMWPLRMSSSLDWNGIGSITNFIDHDTSSALLIYNCNTARTYDGHRGMDIATWPFPWYLANNNYAEVVASAEGVISFKVDGQDDDHCQWGLPGTWNAIFIQHCDGSTTRYGHMKKNSLTSKVVGDSVSKGEFLGIVASSGTSTGPHIHFEIRDANNDVIDPNLGSCNPTSSTSLWDSQRAFREPRLNVNLSHNAKPEHGCPSANEFPHMGNYINPGDSVWLATYFQDQTMGDTTFVRILAPDQSVWQNFQHISPGTYNKSWWWWRRLLPVNGPFGIWTFEVSYRGDVRRHEFQFGNFPVSNTDLVSPTIDLRVYPNPAHESSTIFLKSRKSTYLSLELYDMLGRQIDVLHSGNCSANKEYAFKLENLRAHSLLILRDENRIIKRIKIVSE